MAKAKRSENLIRLRCTVCKRVNYYTRKNKKKVERKIELKKFCPWDRKSTPHKELKLTGGGK
ncbi:MAG: 50S ribosomal protein L33 [Parcubacteria group bacterium GW2011_GWA1_50_14]|uniref:Large ribosomal subunit protein bL33 n=1 Tax=Candidatus Liptonbacteria bacterium GWB1_49_6 TaxID=1798644 RepID=A0A1G2C751_9BACT|nr:MAG: 50S ribosomal protein L33 [Parcubacteria group bacterium GW2011_GWA1_50_14]OGY97203.1 MAG: 50S ribosomal protein L33 [Candidatus Liptonbacteria bacterium GWB1_49_6]